MHSRNLHALAARWCILTASTWTAGLQLWSSSSLAARAGGDSLALDLVNVLVLALVALGWLDILMHDLMRRPLWRRFPAPFWGPLQRLSSVLPQRLRLPITPDAEYLRHLVCLWLYTLLAGAFGVRAFVAAGDSVLALQVGGYYLLFAAGVMIEAAALAQEERSPANGPS